MNEGPAQPPCSTMASQNPVNPSHATFDLFIQAQTCKDVKQHFAELCRQLDINPKDFMTFYTKLKERLNYWKAKALWTKLDKRASHPDYQQGKACTKSKVLAAAHSHLFLHFKGMWKVFLAFSSILIIVLISMVIWQTLHLLLIKFNLIHIYGFEAFLNS